MLEERLLSIDDLGYTCDDIYHSMGYKDTVPEDGILALIDEIHGAIRQCCRPSYVCQILDARQISKQEIEIGGEKFMPGGIICSYLEGMTEACLFVATAGEEYNGYLAELKSQGDIVRDYIADSIGSVIADSCAAAVGKELGKSSQLFHTLPYSPGYCGWNIAEQRKLFSFFPDAPCGVRLSESCLMTPEKSVSGFYGLGAELVPQPYRCEICNNKKCYKRKR